MDDELAVVPSSSHFQLFSGEGAAAVRWRLLSGNNRDMGRGVLVYRDPESCRSGIREVLDRLDELEPVLVPEPNNNTWRWFLRYKGEPVVASGHPYDRKVRCKEGHSQFMRHAPSAQIRDGVVASSARRWTSVIDLRDRPAAALPGQRSREDPIIGRVLR
jgi:uncharacterized protein YegP (UPF0339 family)